MPSQCRLIPAACVHGSAGSVPIATSRHMLLWLPASYIYCSPLYGMTSHPACLETVRNFRCLLMCCTRRAQEEDIFWMLMSGDRDALRVGRMVEARVRGVSVRCRCRIVYMQGTAAGLHSHHLSPQQPRESSAAASLWLHVALPLHAASLLIWPGV